MEQYPNAPIQEAILDVAVTLPETVTLDVLAGFQNGLEERFPTRKERRSWMQSLQFLSGQEDVPSLAPVVVDGFLFLSEDNGKVVQARRDGFTFNKTTPYGDWAQFRAEAKGLWEQYRELAHPIKINRLALRYINRIELPLPFTSFRDYFPLFPEFPEAIPQKLSEFFMRFAAPVPTEPGIQVIVTLTFQPPPPEKPVLPVILDIDAAFVDAAVLADAELLFEKADALRKIKNSVFEASITDKCRALFR